LGLSIPGSPKGGGDTQREHHVFLLDLTHYGAASDRQPY
jgi:hypothetical protein